MEPILQTTCSTGSSIWARRKVNKSVPSLITSAVSTSRDEQVELNVLSLLLGVPLSTLSSPIHPTEQAYRPASPLDSQPPMSPVEMHTAQTAVKAALDVLLNEENPLDALSARTQQSRFPNLRISTSQSSLSAPLSPAMSSLDSPLLSPAESCFSSSSDLNNEDEDGAEPRRKGRARMSQEKRKRLARRREREAAQLLSSPQPFQQQQQHQQQQVEYRGFTRSAPVSPVMSHSPFGQGSNATDSFFFFQQGSHPQQVASAFPRSSVPDMIPSLSSSPSSSPSSSAASSPLAHMLQPLSPIGSQSARSKSPSPPTLVIQPPSPQRLLSKHYQQQHYQQHPQRQQPFYPTQSAYHV